jgi:DNA-binding transcriptional regulator YbjK
MAGKRLSTKAQMTRSSLVTAAALILREDGPAAVTYRNVAKKAGAASSAVGYYFDSIDEVLKEAAEFNMREWA